MTFIVPRRGDTVADIRKALAAFENSRLGFEPDGAVESRSLNPCGQVSGGLFGPGNTCAAGDKDGGSGGGDHAGGLSKVLSNPENAAGFSVDPVHFRAPHDGIMVSLNPEQNTIDAADVASGKARETIGDWWDRYASQLDGSDPTKFIGGWLNTGDGKFYLDVSTRYEAGDAAKALEDAREARQLAVYNIGTGKDTFVVFDKDDPRKPDDYDTKFSEWLSSSGLSEQAYKFGRTTVRSVGPNGGIFHGDDSIPASRRNQQAGVHRGNGGHGSPSHRGQGQGQARAAEEARSLNPCGQVSGGVFGPGNTCAAKGTTAVGPKPRFVVKRPDSEILQTGGVETGNAYRALFQDGTASPSDVLRAYGWKGDGRNIDDSLVSLCGSLDDDKKEAVAAFLVGVGWAVKDHPEIADTAVRASTRRNEEGLAEARFRAAYQGKINAGPLGVTQEEFDDALAKARAEAGTPAAFYNLKAHEITILVDNAISAFGMRMHFSAGSFSSPSPVHIGYHEASHAAHAKVVRREAGLPADGPLSSTQAEKLIEVRDQGAFKMAFAMITDPRSFAIYRDSPRAGKDAPDPIITGELAARVSTYGVTNTQETVAEYLAGVATGGIKRDPAVEEVLRFVHSPTPAAPRPTGELTATYAKERAKALNQGKTSP